MNHLKGLIVAIRSEIEELGTREEELKAEKKNLERIERLHREVQAQLGETHRRVEGLQKEVDQLKNDPVIQAGMREQPRIKKRLGDQSKGCGVASHSGSISTNGTGTAHGRISVPPTLSRKNIDYDSSDDEVPHDDPDSDEDPGKFKEADKHSGENEDIPEK